MSTREQAILYWVLILLFSAILFRKKDILISLGGVIKPTIKVLSNPISIVAIMLNAIYLCVIYYFSYNNNLNISIWHIKDYAIVLFFSIFPIIAYLKRLKFKNLISDKRKELFGIAVVPLFINSTYTFSLFVEMILIFLLTIFSIIVAVADRDEDIKIVAKISNFILMLLSLFMICSAIGKFIHNINDIFTIDFWLSFGLEPMVWIVNLPIIILVREMLFVENKVVFSDYKNRLDTYVKYWIILLKNRNKFRKYRKSDFNISNCIEEAKALPSVGGGRIFIRLNGEKLSEENLILIMSDAILGRNKIIGIADQRWKYPDVVEVRQKNGDWYAFWQDSFVAKKYRDGRIDTLKTIELLGGIKLIQG
ncbi:MAG: hypothetical protein KIA10_02175 [Enterococcus faecium]|uniref:hypothetical protein n=1 Tax=Enterococcus faecium TaxID=1352 RepID=UPI000CF13A7A|nr:hypothetical protein [Enterococcus faecium]EGP5630254.1 hypothetical protein [Enterococcus faecium]MBS6010470.1 hypothetical protein [Enterococcus faecium]PQC82860.1 hypothetical protein CUM69_00950 [Enterococcus faecium]